MNIANMPVKVVRALRERGHTAEHVQYTFGQGHKFNYELDQEVSVRAHGGRIGAHSRTVKHYIERDFDLFHFWNKSMFFEGQYRHLTGFDIPLIKARGKHIAYRFTGYDIRLPSWDKEVNPYSTFRFGYKHLFDEDLQKKYIGFLQEYVDQFIVQDPEMAQFSPKGTIIIPRALDLEEWDYVGVAPTDKPLVVHAPSKPAAKGTEFVESAIVELRSEGLKFDYKRIKNMSHDVAREWYKRADIIIDQILIGATGVLTLEGWALGKPVVLYLREDLFQPFYKTNELPIANANPDTIKKVLRDLVTDFEWRQHLAKKGRKTVEEFHDIQKVIEQYEDAYKNILDRDTVKPTGTRDIDYLQAQAEISQNLSIVVKHTRKKLEETRQEMVDQELTHLTSDTHTELNSKSAFNSLIGDEKLAILQSLLPRIIFVPIKAAVLTRRHIYYGYIKARGRAQKLHKTLTRRPPSR